MSASWACTDKGVYMNPKWYHYLQIIWLHAWHIINSWYNEGIISYIQATIGHVARTGSSMLA